MDAKMEKLKVAIMGLICMPFMITAWIAGTIFRSMHDMFMSGYTWWDDFF